jgi:hypothetical protein
LTPTLGYRRKRKRVRVIKKCLYNTGISVHRKLPLATGSLSDTFVIKLMLQN